MTLTEYASTQANAYWRRGRRCAVCGLDPTLRDQLDPKPATITYRTIKDWLDSIGHKISKNQIIYHARGHQLW